MFIVLGGFQGKRAGNDGSWSPGEVVASKEDAGGVVKKEVREGKRNKKNDMTWHARRTVDPERADYSCTCRDRTQPGEIELSPHDWANGCEVRKSTRRQTTAVFENSVVISHTELLDSTIFLIFQHLTVLPVLPWMMPPLWSGHRSHMVQSGLAACADLDCVTMNGSDGAKARPVS